MKPHNKASALIAEIRGRKILDTTGNGIHCLLGVLSMCGILEGDEDKGYTHGFTDCARRGFYQDSDLYYPLKYWKGKNGVNYTAVNELFGGFCGDRLLPERADAAGNEAEKAPQKKTRSKAERYFTDGVYCVMLTNEERRYLALEELRPEWESLDFYSVTHLLHKRTVMFFEGNTIVKVIYEEYRISADESCAYKDYTEFDTRLETKDRKMLLPLTSKGREKPVTPSNVMAADPFGCCLYIHLKKGESRLSVTNYRNHRNLPVGEYARIRDIGTDGDLHAFMRYYISGCPGDYFERITEIKTSEHRTVKFTTGDIFRCRTDRTHFAYGLIIGKTRDIEKRKELPAEHSFRHLMAQPIMVRMYDLITENGAMTEKELSGMPQRPVQICADNEIIWGTHEIVGHKRLVPEDIQFKLQLARRKGRSEHFTPFTSEFFVKFSPKEPKPKMTDSLSLYFEWGFVQLDIPWENVPDEIRAMLDESVYFDGGVNGGIVFAYCGKTLAEILAEHPGVLMRYDLLLPENRDKYDRVMNFLGLPDGSTYDDFAVKYGGITRREYIDIVERERH